MFEYIYTFQIEVGSQERYNTNKISIATQSAKYYVNNKDNITVKDAEYRAVNQASIIESAASYYEFNKTVILARMAERIICECGSEHTKGNKSAHLRTKKHLNFHSGVIESLS